MSDARDEYGNYKNGYSYDDGQRAGVTAGDSMASADWKIEQGKSKELEDRLAKFGPGTVHSGPKSKGGVRVFFLGMFSLAFIAFFARIGFVYVIAIYPWGKDGLNGELPNDFWWIAIATFAVISYAAYKLWRLTIKFFKWLCS